MADTSNDVRIVELLEDLAAVGAAGDLVWRKEKTRFKYRYRYKACLPTRTIFIEDGHDWYYVDVLADDGFLLASQTIHPHNVGFDSLKFLIYALRAAL